MTIYMQEISVSDYEYMNSLIVTINSSLGLN